MRQLRNGGHRSLLAAVTAVVLAIAGVALVVVGFSHHGQPPPQPTAAQAGRLAPPSPRQSGPPTGSSSGATHGSPGGQSRSSSPGGAHVPTTSPHAATPVQSVGPTLNRSVPVSLDIPTIGVHTSLLHLGLNHDGTLQVPWMPLKAGWFDGSPTPGQVGPAVIAGHVDSYQTGPAVFYRLGNLQPGQKIRVTRSDDQVAVFQVDGVRQFPKAHFPTLKVYGNTNRADLRLITCGNWNPSRQEYDGNVVVFAHLVGSNRA